MAASRMTVKVVGNSLVITIPAEVKNPRPSNSGKTLIVAKTSGNIETEARVLGQPLVVGLNAYIYPPRSGDGK